MRLRFVAVAVVGWVVAGGVAAQPVVDPPAGARAAAAVGTMPDLIRLYQTDESYTSRFARVGWSSEREEAMAGLYRQWLARLEGLDYEALSPSDRIDFHLLRTGIMADARGLELERRRLEEMDPLMPFRAEVQGLELARRRMEMLKPEEAAATLTRVGQQAKKLREMMAAHKEPNATAVAVPQPSAPTAHRAADVIYGLASMLDEWARFYEEFLPEFQWWTRVARGDAQRELRDLAKYLNEEVAGLKGKDEDPLVGDPIGREALLDNLAGEMLAYTPEELVAIGERELAWCEGEMKRGAAEMGLGDDWKVALAKVKEAHVPPGEQAGLVRDEARAAIAWLKERDLVTIPELCENSWRVEMHSVETQRVLPYAVYGGQYMGVSYAAESMDYEHKLMAMRGNNRHFTHIVTPHELIPGHHLQGFYAARHHEYRRMFSTPFLVEGWALYWEMKEYGLGWAGATGNEAVMDRIGMLFWRMHRAARIIVSLKFHLGQMTPGQMIDFLVERVGHERSGATAEVRRYIGGDYSPLYQCGYMIGGLQLMALHGELVDSGAMAEKAFNDGVLKEGTMPIEMIRAALKGEALGKDWKPGWRMEVPVEAEK